MVAKAKTENDIGLDISSSKLRRSRKSRTFSEGSSSFKGLSAVGSFGRIGARARGGLLLRMSGLIRHDTQQNQESRYHLSIWVFLASLFLGKQRQKVKKLVLFGYPKWGRFEKADEEVICRFWWENTVVLWVTWLYGLLKLEKY